MVDINLKLQGLLETYQISGKNLRKMDNIFENFFYNDDQYTKVLKAIEFAVRDLRLKDQSMTETLRKICEN